jgi:hypothetical protein
MKFSAVFYALSVAFGITAFFIEIGEEREDRKVKDADTSGW